MISTAAKQLLVVALLGVLGCAQQAQRPNIVIIFADDLGYGDLAVYGNPNIRTPTLDRMAAEGMRLTDFYSASSVCTPSRAALITGRLPIRSGLNRVLFPGAPGGMPASETTIAEALKDVGYRTAMVGKWHLGDRPNYLPTNNGFESYFGIPYSNDMSARRRAVPPGKKRPTRVTSGNLPSREMPEVPLLRGEKVIERDPDQSLITKRYTAEAVEVINKFGGGEAPFFLYYAHSMPHVPIFASEKFKDRSLAGLYGDVIEEIDWSVGEVLRAIKEVGADENTLVIFASDNGPWLAHKWNGGSAGPFRDGKFSTWEGGVRGPFIARWPNRIPAGAVRHEVASTMDLFPTCLTLAGAKVPSDNEYDGGDIGDLLTGKTFEREALNFYWRETTLAAVRKGDWKLHVDTYDSLIRQGTSLDTPILFNLRLDPGEHHDVAEANPEIVKQLAAVLKKHEQSVTRGDEQR